MADVPVHRRQFQLNDEPIEDPIAFAVTRLSPEEQREFGILQVGESLIVNVGGTLRTLTRTR